MAGDARALHADLKRFIVRRLRLESIDPESIDSATPLVGGGLDLDSIDLLELVPPPAFAVTLVDDFMTEPPQDPDADLVGITAMGLQIGRAYHLADQYRARGKPVVMGGEWVSLNPDQALEHCDAIVKGEAE